MHSFSKNILISLALGVGMLSTCCFADSKPEDLIKKESAETKASMAAMQKSFDKELKDLNTKTQAQLKKMQADLAKEIKTVNDNSQKNLEKVNTNLMKQIKKVQADCAKAAEAKKP